MDVTISQGSVSYFPGPVSCAGTNVDAGGDFVCQSGQITLPVYYPAGDYTLTVQLLGSQGQQAGCSQSSVSAANPFRSEIA